MVSYSGNGLVVTYRNIAIYPQLVHDPGELLFCHVAQPCLAFLAIA